MWQAMTVINMVGTILTSICQYRLLAGYRVANYSSLHVQSGVVVMIILFWRQVYDLTTEGDWLTKFAIMVVWIRELIYCKRAAYNALKK